MSNAAPDALAAIKQQYSSLSDTERKVAEFILNAPERVVELPVQGLCALTGVSNGSVINFCTKVGFQGYTKLKLGLAQSLSQKGGWVFDEVTQEDTIKGGMKKIIGNTTSSFEDTWRGQTEEELSRAVEALMSARRIEIYGVGASAIVAQDAAYRLMLLGLPAAAFTDPFVCSVSAAMLDGECLAMGISHSGRTRLILRAMELAASRGAKTMCITSFAQSPITRLSDIPLVITSRESSEHREAVVSRLTQMLLIDSLCAAISLRQPEKSIVNLDTLADIFEEYR